MKDYLITNKDAWNKRTQIHINSSFYDLDSWIKGATSLNQIELHLLGNVKNKEILHLQCHFGQDTLSLSRLGAKCTGVDFSEKAIEKAKELNQLLQLDANFTCADVYSCLTNIKKKFDIVFTSYGTIGWLPDLNKWAAVITEALKPSGQLVFVDFHPVIWMMNPKLSKIEYSYFKKAAIVEESTGTYTDKTAPISYTEIGWNHGLGEVFQALKNKGIQITDFDEYDYSPYNCFDELEEVEPKKFQFKSYKGMIPMVYSLVGRKIN